METMKREVYHIPTKRIWTVTEWSPKTRLYTLVDGEAKLKCMHNDFELTSESTEPLLKFKGAGVVEDKQKEKAGRPEKAVDNKKEAIKKQVEDLLAPCGVDREKLAGVAARLLGVKSPELIEKYAHLNNGMFKMVLANRMRSSL